MIDLIDRLRDLSQPGDGNDRLLAADEIERLLAIVEKLAMTADNVRVVPGMRLWTTYNNGRDVTGFDTIDGRLTCLYYRDGFDKCTWACYSTREAAEAAKKGGE